MDSSTTRRFVGLEPAPASRAARKAGDDYVPRRCTLGGFAEEAAATDGVNIREAEPLVAILVTTRNSVYRIIPLRRGHADVIVQGGAFFADPTEAHLTGSSFGGSLLKLHWIAVGMHMEIDAGRDEGPVTTTRVLSVTIERDRTPIAPRH